MVRPLINVGRNGQAACATDDAGEIRPLRTLMAEAVRGIAIAPASTAEGPRTPRFVRACSIAWTVPRELTQPRRELITMRHGG